MKRFAVLLVALCGLAHAQPLASLASPDTVLAFGLDTRGEGFPALAEDLAALDWQGAAETAEKLTELFQGTFADFADEPEFNGLNGNTTMTDPLAELTRACPEASEALMSADSPLLGKTSLLTVSVSAFNPLPAVTALTRFETASEGAETLQDAFIACAAREGELTELRQGGVTLYVLGDGSDLPVIVGRTGTLFFAGTNPEVLRGVVRLVQGSDELSFADTPLYGRSSNTLDLQGAYLSVNFAALATLAESFGGFIASQPEQRTLLERATASLRTLGGYSAALTTTAEGVLFESLSALNPEGGDDALANLLLCQGCAAPQPTLAPSTSLSVSAQHLPLGAWVDYLQGWLDDAAPVLGERIDLKETLRDEAGIDIDTALLNWWDDQAYAVTLEPVSRDLRTLLYNASQALILPARDPAAAEVGLAQISDLLDVFLLTSFDPNLFGLDDAFPGERFGGRLDRSFSAGEARRETSYRGVPITRLQAGPNLDLSLAQVEGAIVIGSPGGAVERIIDVAQDGEGILEGELADILNAVPENAVQTSYSNTSAQLAAFAGVLEPFAQPAAFLLSAAVQAVVTPETSEVPPSFLELLELGEIIPRALAVVSEHVSYRQGHHEVQGDAIYRRLLLRVR